MKIKLAALLAFIMIGLAGCTAADNSNATKNTNATNTNTANKTASTETPKTTEVVATNETGGSKEGCKCSAAGMKCNTKPGEKGCCSDKDGSCSTMADGKSSCCDSKGGDGKACCSASGKMAMDGKEKMDNMPASGTEKKTATAPAKKS